MRRVADLLDIPTRELWLVVTITAFIACCIAAFAATALGTPARRPPASLGAETLEAVPLDAAAVDPTLSPLVPEFPSAPPTALESAHATALD